MPTFSRIASLIVFLLSLSLVSFALPTPSSYSDEGQDILVPGRNSNNVLHLLINLEGKIKQPIKLIAEAKTYPEVRAQVEAVVEYLEECNNAVLAASKLGKVNDSTKREIASKAASIISMIVQACLGVSLRLGWFLIFDMFAKIDVCLNVLITNLGACGAGLVALIANTIASSSTQLLISLNFNQSISALAIKGL
ncbi:hypothetical protein RSOLAG22IIIB_12860 [Rhizoctonia solani]|uniref:Transmembrane protein n=1 Tax=Rhizoctonia solani TaxID=456999 RepID=A0A0K6GGV6_9AGAM|nr:hypothetical protein RSOLAG22IIIB_12860 [Rhizoctonia solani]